MTDLFDRPVDWSESRTVAGPATVAATSGNGGKPAFLPLSGDTVASVAAVAIGCADGSFAEGVADRATVIATAESGGKLPKTDVSSGPVAPVAAVARATGDGCANGPVADRATLAATSKNGGFPPMPTAFPDDVAGVATVAGAQIPALGHPQTEGQRLAAALRVPLAGHVADVATVADAGIAQRKSLHSQDFPTLSKDMAAAPATLAATVQNWTLGVRRLRQSPALKFYHGRWYQMVSDARAFLALWAEDALKAGWGTLDVFGVNLDPLHGRYDRLGLVVLLKGRAVQEIGPDSATVGNSAKDTSTYYRQRRAAGGVPVWQWCLEGSQ